MKVVTDAGETIHLGRTETAPTIGIVDYSVRKTDDFGVTTVVERGFSRTMSVKLALPFDQVDDRQRRLAALRATPARYVADDRYATLSVRGFFKDFEFDLNVPPVSYCTLSVEGLVGSDAIADSGGDPAPTGSTSTLRLLQPVIVTDAALKANSVQETDAAEWSQATSYAQNATVIRATTHRVYQSLVDANLANDPVGTSGKWLDIGPTNRWAMFDAALGTTTTAPGTIVVTLDVGAIDGVALLDVSAKTVRVQVGSYDQSQAVSAGAVTFLDLAGRSGQVTVTISGSGQIAVGTLLVGRIATLGITEASPSAGITDYSRKTVDAFGAVTIVERAFAKRMAAKALIRTDAVDAVANRIAAVRARPSLWIGRAGTDSITVYGFFKDFSIEVGENVSKLSLSIEGLSKAAKPAPLTASIDWANVGDPLGTKPKDSADKTSENTSKDTAAVGGRPATEILPKIDRIPPMEAAQLLLKQGATDLDGYTRQIDRDRRRLEEILLKVAAEQNWAHDILRQAGVVIDQAASTVRIYTLDRQAERLNTAEIQLDATKALVSTKVDATYVGQAIAAAQLSPTDLAALTGVIARVTSAEQRLDGLAAQVATKAEAATLTALTGTVTAVSQVLDALTGEVRTKVSTTVFDQYATRLGSVEQTVLALGDVAGITTSIRQARAIGDAAQLSSINALLAADEANRRQIVAAAQARQELTTGITDAGAATARLATLLTAQISAVDARYASESIVRASQIAALTEQTTALSAMVGGLGSTVSQQFQSLADQVKAQATATQQVRADFDPRITTAQSTAEGAATAAARVDGRVSSEVSRLDKAVSDEAGARASAISQARADANGQYVAVEQRVSAVVDRTGKLEGRYSVVVDVNGRLQGYVLAGSRDGPAQFSFIDTDLRMGTGRIIFDTGTYMQVQGLGFGANGELVEWYGPTMPIAQCTRANAITYKTTGGAAYFGGGLAAGVLQNARQSTELAPDASILVGPFGTKGGRKTVVASYAYYLRRTSTSNGGSVDGKPTAGLAVERRIGDGAWEQIGSFAAAGNTYYEPPAGTGEPGYGEQTMSGSVTITDNTPGTTDFSYRLRLTSRSLAGFNFNSPNRGTEQQTLSLQSVEQ